MQYDCTQGFFSPSVSGNEMENLDLVDVFLCFVRLCLPLTQIVFENEKKHDLKIDWDKYTEAYIC